MTAFVRHRWPVLCAIGVAVLASHIVALLLLGPAWLDPQGPAAAAPRMQVRHLMLQPKATLPAPTNVLPAPLESAPAARAEAAAAATAPRSRTTLPAMVAAVPAAAPRSDDAAPAPLADPATLSVDIPIYATRLPPAGQWRYRMQRGLVVGEAELAWAPHGDAGYVLRLQGRVAGITMLDWASQGQLDVAGVAPERFAVRQRGRDRQAANFQREAGKITFSGPTHELPLLPGAQDRLSWMLQLPGVVAAAPERFGAGASVVLFVAGARGGADVWTFVVQGVERLGEVPALKLVREPQRLYDTRAEVWLDPAAHYLPLRVVQTPSGGGAALELQREPN